jgi:LmbE family N-acetylglucosaminyl deacetylase
LLGVWAHPDDEAYLSAGLMAQWVRNGGRVVVVSATRGELGTEHPEVWPPERLAAQRERELRRSLATIGVRDVRVLGFPDGGCEHHDGTAAVAAHIRDVRPDLIVTFGPDGLTGHRDHRAVNKWTTVARDAVRPQADLWYATVTDEFHDRWGEVNEMTNFFYAGQPDTPRTPADELVYQTALSDDLLRLKANALVWHTSQTAGLIERVGMATYREWWRTESFVSADAASGRLPVDLDAIAA